MVAAVQTEPRSTPRRRSLAEGDGRVLRLERVVAARPAPPAASIYRRRRAVAAGLLVTVMLALWAVVGALGGGTLLTSERSGPALIQPAEAEREAGTYVVQPGDTLWSVARQIDPHADPRPIVDRMVEARRGSTLYVGERLPLPAR